MDFYIFEDYSDLENLPSEQWMNFLSDFVSLLTYLIYIFQTRCLHFQHWWRKKKGKNQFFNYFLRILSKFEDKNLEIHKLSWLSITWILKRLNSIQTFVEDIPEIKLAYWSLLSKTYKKSYSKTPTLIVLNKFVCYPNNCLVPHQILSYRESTVAAPISSLATYKILLSFSWLSIMQILFRNLLTVSTVKTSNTKQSVKSLCSWAKGHHIFDPFN